MPLTSDSCTGAVMETYTDETCATFVSSSPVDPDEYKCMPVPAPTDDPTADDDDDNWMPDPQSVIGACTTNSNVPVSTESVVNRYVAMFMVLNVASLF